MGGVCTNRGSWWGKVGLIPLTRRFTLGTNFRRLDGTRQRNRPVSGHPVRSNPLQTTTYRTFPALGLFHVVRNG
jgi:hypothetical protein